MSQSWLKVIEEGYASELAEAVSREIASAFEDDERPTEEQLRSLMRVLACSILCREFKDECVEDLSECVNAFYNYSELDAAEEKLFDIGACWGALTTYQSAAAEDRDRAADGARRAHIEEYQQLFALLFEQPGLRHSDLAQALGYKVSRFSQVMSKLADADLISSVKVGREKRYFLTSKAKDLLAAPRTENAAVLWVSTTKNAIAGGKVTQKRFASDGIAYSEITSQVAWIDKVPDAEQDVEAEVPQANRNSLLRDFSASSLPASWEQSNLLGAQMRPQDLSLSFRQTYV